jgi:hypothetical protein
VFLLHSPLRARLLSKILLLIQWEFLKSLRMRRLAVVLLMAVLLLLLRIKIMPLNEWLWLSTLRLRDFLLSLNRFLLPPLRVHPFSFGPCHPSGFKQLLLGFCLSLERECVAIQRICSAFSSLIVLGSTSRNFRS